MEIAGPDGIFPLMLKLVRKLWWKTVGNPQIALNMENTYGHLHLENWKIWTGFALKTWEQVIDIHIREGEIITLSISGEIDEASWRWMDCMLRGILTGGRKLPCYTDYCTGKILQCSEMCMSWFFEVQRYNCGGVWDPGLIWNRHLEWIKRKTEVTLMLAR